MNLNYVHLVGNVATDPELRYTNNGTAVTSFRLAVSKPRRDDEEQPPDFFTVKTFGQFAENVAESYIKGVRVVVDGRLVDDSYEKDGVTHRQTAIIADEVAASVRWATVQVTKNDRRDTTDPTPTPVPTAAASTSGEEPF